MVQYFCYSVWYSVFQTVRGLLAASHFLSDDPYIMLWYCSSRILLCNADDTFPVSTTLFHFRVRHWLMRYACWRLCMRFRSSASCKNKYSVFKKKKRGFYLLEYIMINSLRAKDECQTAVPVILRTVSGNCMTLIRKIKRHYSSKYRTQEKYKAWCKSEWKVFIFPPFS